MAGHGTGLRLSISLPLLGWLAVGSVGTAAQGQETGPFDAWVAFVDKGFIDPLIAQCC